MTVREQVDRDLEALVTTHPMGEALAEVARVLASRLDDPDEKAPAQVAKELRATLVALAERAVDDDDDLEARLSTPVRDAEIGSPDVGSGGGRGGSPLGEAADAVAAVRRGRGARG